MDNTTGYPYYWNRVTNEVKWDRPASMPPPPTSKKTSSIQNSSKSDISSKSREDKRVSSTSTKKKSRSKSPPSTFIGPTLPQLTPEEVARQKVVKFEEAMAKEIERDILKEDPIDWKSGKVHKSLYSKPFAWKKSSTCLQTFKDLESTLKKASQSISLIAGNYGDYDSDESDSENESISPSSKSSSKKRKFQHGIQVKVQKPESKRPKTLLKEIPGIFKNDEEDEETNGNATEEKKAESKNEDPPKKKGRWGIYICWLYTFDVYRESPTVLPDETA